MAPITRTCQITGQQFTISDFEQALLQQMNLPLPTTCIEARHQNRMAFRNERNLYHGTCKLTNKNILSTYHPDSPYTIYCQEAWWGDNWDPTDYGQDYDFSRPFFEQFKELQLKVPRMNLFNSQNENSDYCSFTTKNKNCYLVIGGDINEDSLYSGFNFYCKNVLDTYFVTRLELCYECLDCEKCYNLKYSQNSHNCSDSAFLYDCRGCKNCLGCVGLRNKEYHIYNIPHTKEEYEAKLAGAALHTRSGVAAMNTNFEQFKARFPLKAVDNSNCENCTGDHLTNCKNCINCFDIFDAEDIENCMIAGSIKSCASCCYFGHKIELFYEMVSSVRGNNNAFCISVWDSNNIRYSDSCMNSNNLFGCVSLKRKQFSILNKQYTEQEYHQMIPRIIVHMKSTGEWGKFFPMHNSPFAYNETVAQEYFPLTKDQAVGAHLNWRDKDHKEYQFASITPPDNIDEVDNTICNQILACEVSGKNYKIIPAELQLYKRMRIPVPSKSPETRHNERFAKRNYPKLYPANCAKTGQAIWTSYPPQKHSRVYSEQAYEEYIYGA
jgi:hypothetical protein